MTRQIPRQETAADGRDGVAVLCSEVKSVPSSHKCEAAMSVSAKAEAQPLESGKAEANEVVLVTVILHFKAYEVAEHYILRPTRRPMTNWIAESFNFESIDESSVQCQQLSPRNTE